MDNDIQAQENNILPKKTLIDRIYGERNTPLQKLLTIASVIFFILIPIILIYNIIIGFASVEITQRTMKAITFFTYIMQAITSSAVYAFYGLVLAALKKIIDK